MRGLVGVNMTNFFNRELFMYSLGDIRFKKPISLKKMAYVTVFFLVWTLPIIMIFGIQLNPIYIALLLAPPLALGHYATKPIFGGKTLIPAVKTVAKYIFTEPKCWTDLKANNELGNKVYFTENEIWISRRRELQLLADLKEKKKREARVARKKR